MRLLLHWSLQVLNVGHSKFKNHHRRAHPDGLNPLHLHAAQWDAVRSQCPDPTPASVSSRSKLVHVWGGRGVEERWVGNGWGTSVLMPGFLYQPSAAWSTASLGGKVPPYSVSPLPPFIRFPFFPVGLYLWLDLYNLVHRYRVLLWV